MSGSVYGHAAGSLSSNAVVLSNVIVGYTSTQTNTIGVSNAAGFRVALSMMTNAPASNNVTLSGVTNVASGTSSNAVLTFSTNQGPGAFTNRISVVYGDASSLAGASTNVGTGTLTVTGAIYDHAAGSLTNSNVVFAVHVGNTNTQTALVGMSNAVGFRVSMATLATNSSNGLSLAGVTNVGVGTSSNAVLTYSSNNGVITSFTNQIGVVYGDASSYDGASSAVGTNMLTVKGYVYSGQSTWTAGSGNWTNFTNWTALGGTPGLDGALSTNDTATFGTGGGGVVTLSTNAVLNALTFSNASSYAIAGAGTISLEQGSSAPSITTLQGSHTISNALALSTNVIVTNASGTMLTLSGSIGGAGILTNSGSGTLMLAASNSYTGGTVLNGGKVAIANASSFGTGAITFANNATVAALTTNLLVTNNYTIAGSATGTFEVGAGLNFDNSGLISGGSLAKIGAGTLTLSTLNAYTNGTFIYDGALVVNATNALGTGAVTITNGALLDFSIVGSGAVTNTLIGNGVVVTTGAGTLTLGDSTTNFTGTIGAADGGILRLTNTNSVGMATNLLLDGGTLRISGAAASNGISNTITVASNSSGVIEHGTGTGTLTLAGTLVKNAATLTLMGTNTGEITITGGITGSSPNSDLVYDSGTFNVNASNSYNGPTYLINGAVVNANVLYALPIANGRSAVYLDQTNTGGILGSGTSTLNINTNQAIASLSGTNSSKVNLSNSILTIGTNSLTTNTFAGTVAGAGGSLIKDGSNAQRLSGNNTYTGGTTLSGGKLIASSASALGNGTLQLNAGTLVVDTAILTLSSMTWSDSAVIAIPTAGNFLSITNTLTLTGVGTNLFNLSGVSLSATPIELLSAPNLTNTYGVADFGVTGLTNNYTLSFLNDGLYIALSVPAYPNFMAYAVTYNQQQVAGALNTWVANNPTGDETNVLSALTALTNSPSEMQSAYNQISPTMYQSLSTIAFNLANAQNSELMQRLWNQRVAESGGFSMSGFADNTPIWEGQGDGAGIMDPNKDILRPGPDNRWGLFLDGNGIFAQANSGNMLPTYNAQSGGMTVGVTYRVNPVISVGAYTGYEGTYAKYNAGSTLIDNSVRFGLFATYGKVDNRGFYVSALLGGGYNQYQVTRNIQFSGINRTANSQPGAGELDTMLAGGYNIRKGNWTFGPTTSLQYTYLGVNGFNETGAQSLNLTSGGWNTASMLGSLGAQAAYTWQATKNLVVVPQISASWQHEFMQNPYAINSSMGGVNFSNLSSAPLRDFLYTGIGVTLEFKQRWFTSIFYNAAAGNNDLQSQNIFWSFGCKF